MNPSDLLLRNQFLSPDAAVASTPSPAPVSAVAPASAPAPQVPPATATPATPEAAPYVPSAPSVRAPSEVEMAQLEAQRQLHAEIAELRSRIASTPVSQPATSASPAAFTQPAIDPNIAANDPALAEVMALKTQMAALGQEIGKVSGFLTTQEQARAREAAAIRANELRDVTLQQTQDWIRDVVIKGDPELSGNDVRSQYLAKQIAKDAASWVRSNFQPSDDPNAVKQQLATFSQLTASRIRELKTDFPPIQVTPREVAHTLDAAARNNLSAPSTPSNAPASPPAEKPLAAGAGETDVLRHLNSRMIEVARARGFQV